MEHIRIFVPSKIKFNHYVVLPEFVGKRRVHNKITYSHVF